MKNVVLKSLCIVLLLTFVTNVKAGELPHVERVSFAAGFDDAYVLCQTVSSDNGTLVASVSNPQSSFSRIGETQVTKLDALGLKEWSIEIPGNATVGAVLQVEDSFVVVGQCGEEVDLGGTHISAGNTFVAILSLTGSIETVRSYADYSAEYARLHAAVDGRILVVVGQSEKPFGNNVLAELGSNGELTVLRIFDKLVIGDLATNEQRELFVAGMLLGRDTIDGIEITPSFGYINILAKFDAHNVAEWINLSEHISIDRENRVKLVHDKVAFLALEKAEPPMLLQPVLSVYTSDGQLESTLQLVSKHTFKSASVGVVGEYIVIAHDRQNSLGASTKDTADVWVYNSSLELQDKHTIVGDITFHQSVLQSVHMSNIDGGTRISWLCDSAQAEVDGVDVSMTGNHANGYMLFTDLVVEGITHVNNYENSGPAINSVVSVGSLLDFGLEVTNEVPVEFYDLQGRVQHSTTIRSGSVHIPNVPEGHYTLVVDQQVVMNVVIEQ